MAVDRHRHRWCDGLFWTRLTSTGLQNERSLGRNPASGLLSAAMIKISRCATPYRSDYLIRRRGLRLSNICKALETSNSTRGICVVPFRALPPRTTDSRLEWISCTTRWTAFSRVAFTLPTIFQVKRGRLQGRLHPFAGGHGQVHSEASRQLTTGEQIRNLED